MLDACKNKEERWHGVQQLINRWLAERQELVVLYCSLNNTANFNHHNGARALKMLRQFSQTLLDYVSAGHFEVYNQLIKEAEDFHENHAALWQTLYPKINQSTALALQFNDSYATSTLQPHSLDALRPQLSLLGESLVSRFTFEDQLIATLHSTHNTQVLNMPSTAARVRYA